MDPHSELELKFKADDIYVDDVSFAIQFEVVNSYKKVDGWDRYYEQNGRFLRHRCDGKRKTSVLTVKARKHKDSLADRTEIDMPISAEVPEADVTAFLKLTGWKLYFEIDKTSYIWHVEGDNHNACIALYDVSQESTYKVKRFLEIEIDKDSECTDAEGKIHLNEWAERLRKHLDLDAPLNQSLFEMYDPANL